MGSHSGYEQVCDTLANRWINRHQNVFRTTKPLPRVARRLLSKLPKQKYSATYNEAGTLLELQTLWRCFARQHNLVHAVYAERNLNLLPSWKKQLSFKLVATIHQPAGLWRIQRHQPDLIATLDEVIVLSSKEVTYFNQYLPNRVRFIPHGVDIDFFHPPAAEITRNKHNQPPRCVFCGTWLRDLPTLARIIDKLLAHSPNIQFDLVVPISKRKDPNFYRIARHEQVTWHAGISDQQLRSLYQQATLLCLPLLDCTANNALLEAIACGLPIVSNNVGGMPDYTKETFANLLPVGDVDGFVQAALTLIDSPKDCIARGQAARSFAEQTLNWDTIAAQTMQVYEKALA